MEAFLHGTRFKRDSHSALNSFHKRFMGVLVVNLFKMSEEMFKIWFLIILKSALCHSKILLGFGLQ